MNRTRNNLERMYFHLQTKDRCLVVLFLCRT